MSDADLIESDQERNAPHPRRTYAFFGHESEEAELAAALRGGRMHHAWLLGGPKGVGKATLAYRFARRLLGAPQSGGRPLDADPEDPVARKIAAGSHPDLFVLRRTAAERSDRFRRDIAVEDARALTAFFALKPAEGGWRVAIVDAVDDLNRNSANALLKTLEEPPPRAVLLLIAHAPGAALPTIRSRCRRLDLRPLNVHEIDSAARSGAIGLDALTQAHGRPGRAIAQAGAGADEIARVIERGVQGARTGGVSALVGLAFERAGGAAGDRLALTLDVAQDWLRQRARAAAEAGGEGAAYADAWFEIEELRAQAQELNLDPTHGLARAAQILSRLAAAP
ncbi:MAG: DNA polymerase III subunit delta' [Hyphomonadaceae bacterium]